MGELGLGARECEILATIVRRYVSSGVPVGSKAVTEFISEDLSPATVRNIMAQLDEAGFLEQPHVSAGRIPTDRAYRFYVDRLVSKAHLRPSEERFIHENLEAKTGEPEQLMAKTSQVLSKVSRQVGLVMGPALEEKLLEHIKFVKLPEQRVLAVIVSKPDLIENKVFRLEEEFSQEELDRASRFLNSEFRGWSLRAIRLEIFMRVEEERIIYDRLVKNVASLFTEGALAEEAPGPLYVEGTENILARPDFESVRKMKELLATFEEKSILIRILNACLKTPSPGVRVLIGGENPASEMRECTLVVAPIHYHARAVGALGVVGPTRMEYDHTISTVDYVSRLCSKLLSVN